HGDQRAQRGEQPPAAQDGATHPAGRGAQSEQEGGHGRDATSARRPASAASGRAVENPQLAVGWGDLVDVDDEPDEPESPDDEADEVDDEDDEDAAAA